MSDDITPYLSVIDAADNMFIAYCMGWDMEGTVEVMKERLIEFLNVDRGSIPKTEDAKLCSEAIKKATAMYFSLTLVVGTEELHASARQLDDALKAIEHLRQPEITPTWPA
jgi:hypothetical protein